MIFFKKYLLHQKIKKELLNYIATNIELKNKNINQLKKSDLDSVDLMGLVEFIEERWGKIALADLYQAHSFDEIVRLVAQNKKF